MAYSTEGFVVIVEDHDLLRPLLADAVSDLGFAVKGFSTADDALMFAMRAHGNVRLMVTDYSMPGQIHGGELAKMMAERYPDVPVIITSGHDLAQHEYPSVTLLPKPWDVTELQSMIIRMIA